MKFIIKYFSYPLVVGGGSTLLIVLATAGVSYWPIFPLLVAVAYFLVAMMERVLPYQKEWLDSFDDTAEDVMHLLTTQVLIQISVAISFWLRPELWQGNTLWPTTWPMVLQVLLAGVIFDFGLYVMHRASHANGFFWSLHALHHSSERLYWLNGGRRHPLSALVLAGPGLLVLLLLGATPIAVGAWLAITSIHLGFQHANLDYRLGPAKNWLGVGELHRWHHQREYEHAEVNFGEVWMFWDHVFGSFEGGKNAPRAGEIGLLHESMPHGYLRQLIWPFRRASRETTAEVLRAGGE